MEQFVNKDLNKCSREELISLVQEARQVAESMEAEKIEFIESSYDGFWDWNLQESTEYMSPRFWEIFGVDHTKKKHLPSEWQDLIFQEDLQVALENLKKHCETRGEHPYSQEVRYRHADGSTVTVLCRGRVVEWSEDGEPIRMIGTHTDVTLLKEAQVELEAASRLKSQFLANVSHELRSPLNTLMLLIKLFLENRENNLTEQQLENLEQLNNSANDLHLLVNDLLDHSKIEKGMIDIRAAKVSVGEIIGSTIKMFAAQFEAKGVELTSDVSHLEDDCLTTDRHRVEQILRNLLSNSLKFTPQGGQVSIGARWDHEPDERLLQITVTDTGIGISPNELEEIFSPFHQGSEGKKRRHLGTGLGLAICKHLTALLGGNISVTSELAEGSTFTLRVPDLSKVQDAIESSLSIPAPDGVTAIAASDLSRLAGLRCLIVDDDLRHIFALRQVLSLYNVHPLQAVSAPEAVKLCGKTQGIDVVLMDVMLGEANGFEVAETIASIPHMAAVPIVFMSASPDYLKQVAGNRQAFCLQKPITLDQLVAALLKGYAQSKEAK